MAKQAKVMDGQEIFYTKLNIYLHIYKHKSLDNLAAVFGVPRSTSRKWINEFNRSRLESILKNYNLEVFPESEGLRAEECDLLEIRKMLVKQAEGGSTAATKLLLDFERKEQKPEEEQLTVEKAVALIREWCGPRKCSQCGHEEGKPQFVQPWEPIPPVRVEEYTSSQ